MKRVALLFAFLSLGLSGCETVGKGPQAEKGYQAAAPIIAALEKFHHDHGRYPAKLRELVPKYLPQVHQITASKSWEDQTAKFQYYPESKRYTLTFAYFRYDDSVMCCYDSVTKKWEFSVIT